MKIRAKFCLTAITEIPFYPGYPSRHEFMFMPQYDDTIPEDRRFSEATPDGQLKITVDNPPVIEFWKSRLGKAFYLDFTAVDEKSEQ